MHPGERNTADDPGQKPIASGAQAGSYRIEFQIGEGGMGTVYRALDTKLNRPVAIKFLSNDLADEAARRRFQREAQMASSLNHPHILTVHDVGEFAGRQYLVTEFVDGGTLKDWARSDTRAWRQIVELLVGVADGLAAAHAAGITHRDIKPANILVSRNGYAKLADFGLAKLAERLAPEEATRTLAGESTRPGLILGTIAYMSPEQASGRPLDARSDIFSFGVVLYELLSGHKPFAGSTDLEVLQTVIHGTPFPLGDEIPAALRTLVEKALEKDPAERYQSMRELVVDLRRLTRQSVETAPPRIAARARRFQWAAAAGLILLALLAGTLVLYLSRQSTEPVRREYTQITNFADSATSPALSPDGRMLAFIRGQNTFLGQGQIYVKLLPDGEPVQLTNDALDKMGPQFSPDGSRIAYSVREASWNTWIVQVLGGQPPRRFLENASGLTWIQTGTGQSRILFSEMTGRGAQMPIVASTESRGEHRTIYLPSETGMAHRSYLSPDRKQVLLVEMSAAGGWGWLPCRLTPFDGSGPGKAVGPAPAACTEAAWSPDGKWMYFTANVGSGYHIWRQRFPDGALQQVTFGATTEEGIAFAPDGRSFLTSVGASQSTVWVHDSHRDRQITSEGYSFLPSISPDAKKLYYLVGAPGMSSFLSGALWVADLESGQRQRLLPDFQMRHFNISADGQRVVFVADDAGRSPVWLAAVNGRSAPRRLTVIDSWRAFFGAGGDVIFAGLENGSLFVHRVKEDGSELKKVLPKAGLYLSAVSPDGQWVVAPGGSDEVLKAIMIYPVGSGSATMICRSCAAESGSVERGPASSIVSWSPDGRFLYLEFEGSTYAIPLGPGQVLPRIPAAGFQSKQEVAALPGARLMSEGRVFPGPNPSLYAFTKVAVQRNIYRVPVP